ncbi:hypothetical protein Tco_1229098 [Tanacetum coccineum]
MLTASCKEEGLDEVMFPLILSGKPYDELLDFLLLSGDQFGAHQGKLMKSVDVGDLYVLHLQQPPRTDDPSVFAMKRRCFIVILDLPEPPRSAKSFHSSTA